MNSLNAVPLQNPSNKITTSTASLLILGLTILTACEGNTVDPKKIQSFCQSIQLGTDFEELAPRLPNMGLETRTRAPEAGSDISNRASNPYTVDGSVITSSSLPYPETVPACIVYYSSKVLGGNGKIVHKQFTASPIEGL